MLLQPGKVLVNNTKMYVGTSSGSTKEVQFVGESSGSLINGNISLGSIVTLWYTDILWQIVHIDETNNEVVQAKHLFS